MRLPSHRARLALLVLMTALLSSILLALQFPLGHAEAAPGLLPPMDDSTNTVIVALAPLTRTTPIELVALTLDVTLSESDGHTIAAGASTFKLHNTDVTDPFSATIGFPEWAGGALSFDPTRFTSFQLTSDNKKVSLAITPAPVKIGQETRTINWYSFPVDLDPDEKKVLRVDFTQDLGTGVFPRFTYGLLPSNSWKGSIGSARLHIQLPDPTQGEQFIALDPSLPQFDGEGLTWLWTDFEPSADPGVTLIRPSLWTELVNRRTAVSTNPNDANQHAALARIYQELASPDSPRRDNFMSQAVAELETAARLDPKNVQAVSSLAQVYETRAGPAAGPRDIRYVALALSEWVNLIGSRSDADARKNAGEDSFYLGIAARASRDNDLALKYFADAANFSPQGAGPLYTREHWKSETQAAHVALAQAAIAAEDVELALSHGRAAFGNDFGLGPAPALPAFGIDRATISTRSAEREITIRLRPFPGVSDQARKTVEQVVAAMNRTGDGLASLQTSESSYTISLSVPFNAAEDLTNRLHELARALPVSEDWNVVRGILESPGIEWEEQGDTLTRTVHYREQIDLATNTAPLRARLDELSRLSGQLDKAGAGDARSQLTLALLRYSQQWWQHTLATAVVRFELQPASAPPQSWTAHLGDQTTLRYDNSGTRPEVYIVGAVAGALLLLTLILLMAIWRRFARRRRRVVA